MGIEFRINHHSQAERRVPKRPAVSLSDDHAGMVDAAENVLRVGITAATPPPFSTPGS
jgi:hypothetical protein